MPSVVVDTHATVWYLCNSPRLSKAAADAIRAAIGGGFPVYVPSISLVEITYLVERGRVPASTYDDLIAALQQPNFGFVIQPLNQDVAEAVRRIPAQLVPEMPDRIIAGTALYLNLPLITRDRKIQTAPLVSIW